MLARKAERKRPRVKQFGRFFSAYLSICARALPDKLTPRGHHDWPDKRVFRPSDHPASGWLHWSGSIPMRSLTAPVFAVTAEIFCCCLNGDVPEQKLDLVESPPAAWQSGRSSDEGHEAPVFGFRRAWRNL